MKVDAYYKHISTYQAKMAKRSEPVLPSHHSRKPTTVRKKNDTNYVGLVISLIVLGVIIALVVLSTGDRPIAVFVKSLMWKAGAGALPNPKIVLVGDVDIFGNPITKKPDPDGGDWIRSTTTPPVTTTGYNHEFDRSKIRPPVDQATHSKYTLDYGKFRYKWSIHPYSYENAEKICKQWQGNLVYFDSEEEFIKVRNFTIMNVTDRYPLEEQKYYLTAGNRPYLDEIQTPYPDNNQTIPVIENLKWNISGNQVAATLKYNPWCEDRLRDLGNKTTAGWGKILAELDKEKSATVPLPPKYSIKPMLDLKVMMDFEVSPEENKMGCLKFEYGQNDAAKEENMKLDELSRPSGMPFICKIPL